MNQPNILIFFETVIFSLLVLAWATYEYISVTRLQKKTREEEAAKAKPAQETQGAEKPD